MGISDQYTPWKDGGISRLPAFLPKKKTLCWWYFGVLGREKEKKNFDPTKQSHVPLWDILGYAAPRDSNIAPRLVGGLIDQISEKNGGFWFPICYSDRTSVGTMYSAELLVWTSPRGISGELIFICMICESDCWPIILIPTEPLK